VRGIRARVQERKSEAETLLELLGDVIKQPNSVVRSAILKSTHMLMLYNFIEATATEILEQIHEILSKEKYLDLSPEIRRLWVEYFFYKQANNKKFDNLEATIWGEACFPQLKEFRNHVNLYSGNLDARAINTVLKKYGIGVLATQSQHKLLEIKNKRNRIVHGEEMFKEACRHLTITELEAFQAACFDAIESVLDMATEFISTNKYKAVA
jgi:hypothetical protein